MAISLAWKRTAVINSSLLLAFLLTAGVLLIIPGPTILTVVAYGLRAGRRAVWASTAGVVLGDATAVVVCLAGLGAVLAVSASAYAVIKWVGVGYLLFLAVQTWRESRHASAGEGQPPESDLGTKITMARVFRQTFLVTALNPKGIVFFLAFIPQFVDDRLAYGPQVAVYGTLFVILGGVNASLYAYSSGRLAALFTRPAALKWMKRASAGFLGSAALITAFHKVPNP